MDEKGEPNRVRPRSIGINPFFETPLIFRAEDQGRFQFSET
jgi:hypothetical protein